MPIETGAHIATEPSFMPPRTPYTSALLCCSAVTACLLSDLLAAPRSVDVATTASPNATSIPLALNTTINMSMVDDAAATTFVDPAGVAGNGTPHHERSSIERAVDEWLAALAPNCA